jgi:hypothetical protein
VTIEALIPGIIGATVGVLGWLAVGIYIQRRQFMRQARSAARAVYFELDVNRAALLVARDLGSFSMLNRSSFDRLLPELATLFPAGELQTVVAAYMGHAGYGQAAADPQLPAPVRNQLLDAILAAHDAAVATVRVRAFTTAEARNLAAPGPEAAARREPRRGMAP